MGIADFVSIPTAPLAQTLVGSPDTSAHNLAGVGDWH